MKQTVLLLLSDSRGVYIPQHFAQDFAIVGVDGLEDAPGLLAWRGIKPKDVETLRAGPDEEWYWEAWDSVLNNAFWLSEDGWRFTLSQDGDLWALCYEHMSAEEKRNFGMEPDGTEDTDEDAG